MRAQFLALLLASLAVPALAAPVDEQAARKMLFQPKGFSMQYVEGNGLTDQQRGIFKLLVEGRDSRTQFGRLARYYGAIAISPSLFELPPAKLLTDPESVPIQFTNGFHSPAAADAAALKDCEAIRTRRDKPCVVAARVLPKRFKSKDLTLSVAATAAFKAYRKADGPKAFAISPSSQAFGLAEGDIAVEEALEACNAKLPRRSRPDCLIVIQDER